MRGRLVKTLTLGATLVLGVVATATGEQTHACPISTLENGCVGIQLEAGLFPTDLPKTSFAPVTLQMSGTFGGSSPESSASEMTFDFDRNGLVNAAHLPKCTRSQLETPGVGPSQGPCARSRLGIGAVTIEVESSGNSPITVPITLYNGSARDGTTKLFIRGFSTLLGSTATVATVNVREIHEVPFGLQASVRIPSNADRKVSVHSFYFVINRIFRYKGTRQGYAMARCLNGHLSARLSTTTIGGERFSSTAVKPCKPKK